MTVEARYYKNHVECRKRFQTVADAAEEMVDAWEMGWLNPIGIWEDGEKILCHDDILEWGEDDETV